MTWPKSVFQWVSNLVIFWRIPDENPNSCDDAAGHLGCPFWDTHPISFLRTSRNQWKNIHSNTGCFVHRKRVHWGDDLTTLPAAAATPCFCPDSDTCTCLAHSGGKACPGLVQTWPKSETLGTEPITCHHISPLPSCGETVPDLAKIVCR